MTPSGRITCANPNGQTPPCDQPAMIERMPNQKSSRHIHRMCFPCACRFHRTSTQAQLVQAALIDYWRATAPND